MKSIFLVPIILLLSSFQTPNDELVKKQINEQIQLLVPSKFEPMSQELMDQRYLTARKPLAAFTNERQVVDLTVSTSNTRWQASDLPILKDFYKASLMELYDEVDFLKEEIEEINGRNFVVFEFTSLVKPGENSLTARTPVRRYTRIQYTVNSGQTLVFNFSCPQALQPKWLDTAQQVMESVKIKS